MTATGSDGAAADLLDTPGAGGAAIRGSLLRTGGFAVSMLLALVSAPILTRHLGVADFGRYSAVVSLIALVASVTDAGLAALGVRELAVLAPAGRVALMRNLLGIRIALTVLGVLGALGFALLAGYAPALVLGVVLAGLGLLTFVLQGMFGLPLAAELRFGWLTAAEVLRQLVYVVAIVALVLGGAGLAPLLGATIAGGVVGLAMTMWLVRGRVPWRPAFEVAAWRRILRETLPIAAAGAIASVYFRLVILVMSVSAPTLETGYYALSFRIVEVAITVPFVVIGALLPVFSRAAETDQARLAYAFERTFEVAVIGGLAFTLLCAVGAPLAIGFLTGDPAGRAVEVLRLQSFGLLPAFVAVAYGSAFVAMRRHRELVLVTAAALGATAVLAPVLVAAAGAKGGAVAAVCAEATVLVGSVVAMRRARPDLHPSLRVLPRALVAAVLAALAARLVRVPVVPNLGAVAIAGAVYLAGLVALRAIPRELAPALLGRR